MQQLKQLPALRRRNRVWMLPSPDRIFMSSSLFFAVVGGHAGLQVPVLCRQAGGAWSAGPGSQEAHLWGLPVQSGGGHHDSPGRSQQPTLSHGPPWERGRQGEGRGRREHSDDQGHTQLGVPCSTPASHQQGAAHASPWGRAGRGSSGCPSCEGPAHGAAPPASLPRASCTHAGCSEHLPHAPQHASSQPQAHISETQVPMGPWAP